MRDLVSSELDRVDLLPVGSGALDIFGVGRGDFENGFLGAGAKYRHRITRRSSLFGTAEVGYQYGDDRGLAWEALLGYRRTF